MGSYQKASEMTPYDQVSELYLDRVLVRQLSPQVPAHQQSAYLLLCMGHTGLCWPRPSRNYHDYHYSPSPRSISRCPTQVHPTAKISSQKWLLFSHQPWQAIPVVRAIRAIRATQILVVSHKPPPTTITTLLHTVPTSLSLPLAACAISLQLSYHLHICYRQLFIDLLSAVLLSTRALLKALHILLNAASRSCAPAPLSRIVLLFYSFPLLLINCRRIN
jgi:hypothetical protein